MTLRADHRAQSIQVGAVLLFAILIIAFSTYQAFIVPEQNERVEFEHNQEVRGHLADLRNAIVSTRGGAGTSASVSLGTQYPPRAIALNPNPPSGSLTTVGTDDPDVTLDIRNATAPNESVEVGRDVWNGTERTYETGGLVYRPTYNRYAEAPVTGFEHTVLYDEFEADTLVAANQSFIHGTDVSLLTLDGSLQRSSSGSTSVDARPISAAQRSVSVTGANGSSPIRLNVSSRLSEERWNRILSDQKHVIDVTEYPSASGEFTTIEISLDPDQEYDLRMTKAAVGTGATGVTATYLTDVDGGGSVARGNDREVTVEVRDEFNNPVPGVPVWADTNASGAIEDDRKTTTSGGRATFTFATSDVTTGPYAVNLSMDGRDEVSATAFDDHSMTNVSVVVDVTDGTGGGGAYTLDWTDPSTEDENQDSASLTDCGPDSCTWDVGASDEDTLSVNATIAPPFQNVSLAYAVDDPDVATVSPRDGDTGSDGFDRPTLTAQGGGTVNVLASANDASDRIEFTVENVTGGGGGGQVLQPVEVRDTTENRLVFRIENTGSQQVTVEQFSIDIDVGLSNTVLDDGNGAELEILRTSNQNGEANRNGNPTNFEVDGTRYDLEADSDQGNTGAYAVLEPEDDEVDVDFREFQPGIGTELALVGSESEADVVAELILSDGSVQPFYFEAA